MSNCIKCVHLFSIDICYFCNVKGQEIPHPYFMGGEKKCECYQRRETKKIKFVYPSLTKKKIIKLSNNEMVKICKTNISCKDCPLRYKDLCLKHEKDSIIQKLETEVKI